MTRILIADDHPFILSGLEAVLRGTEFEVVGTACDGVELLDCLEAARADILVLDVNMPNRSGMDVIRILRNRGDERRIVLLTASLDDASLIEAIQLRVDGIILKDGAQALLLRCLREVQQGRRWIDKALLERALYVSMKSSGTPPEGLDCLSTRERAVAGLVAQGLKNRDIASDLGLTEGTVKIHLYRIYQKVGVANRTELAMLVRNAAG